MKVVTFTVALSLLLAACTPLQPGAAPTPIPATPPSAETEATNTPESAPESASEDPLVGTQWVLQSFGAPGSESATVGETAVTLEFSNNGQVDGNAGCNSFSGSYQVVEGNTLAFGEIISTLMACVDTAQMDQEILYLEALQTVSTFQIEGDRLIVTYDDGQSVLNFINATASPSEEEAPATETPAPEAAAPSIANLQSAIYGCLM